MTPDFVEPDPAKVGLERDDLAMMLPRDLLTIVSGEGSGNARDLAISYLMLHTSDAVGIVASEIMRQEH